ncbi:MAG: hypothetical protein ACI9UR_000110 [Bacteroidia bacterium]|jgi:hypothetical protein
MYTNNSLISQFIACHNTREALAITDSCKSLDAFLAVVDLHGAYLRVSDTAKAMIGCDLNCLKSETIFSMAIDTERPELFKACSRAVIQGSVYRISHHIKCSNSEKVPVVTHMKKVIDDTGIEMILCMNVKA